MGEYALRAVVYLAVKRTIKGALPRNKDYLFKDTRAPWVLDVWVRKYPINQRRGVRDVLPGGWKMIQSRESADQRQLWGMDRLREEHDIDFPPILYVYIAVYVSFDTAFAFRDGGLFAGVGFLE